MTPVLPGTAPEENPAGMPLYIDNEERPCTRMCEEISAPVVLGSVLLRGTVRRAVALLPAPETECPRFRFLGADGFRLTGLCAVSYNELLAIVEYDIHYTDGTRRLRQKDTAIFRLPGVMLPQPGGIRRFESGADQASECAALRAEALAGVLGSAVCGETGVLLLALGGFFYVQSLQAAGLVVPALLCGAGGEREAVCHEQ